MSRRIHDTSRRARRVRDIGPKAATVDADAVMEALGAERVSGEPIEHQFDPGAFAAEALRGGEPAEPTEPAEMRPARRGVSEVSNQALFDRARGACGCRSCRDKSVLPCPKASFLYGFAASVRDATRRES